MKPWTQMTFALGLAISVAACGGDGRTGYDTTAGRDTGAAVGTSGVGMTDRNFIQEQIEMNEAEVTIGRLAQERASNAQVREFAQAMVRDHETALRDLRQIASQHNVEVEQRDEIGREHGNVRDGLMERSGAEFDREFMNWAVDKHEDAVDDVEGKLESDNQAVRQWASQTLPKLRQHLEQARTIQQSLEQGNQNNRGNTRR